MSLRRVRGHVCPGRGGGQAGEEGGPALVVDDAQVAGELVVGEPDPGAGSGSREPDRHQRRPWWQVPGRVRPPPRERDEIRRIDLLVRALAVVPWLDLEPEAAAPHRR